MRKRAPSRSQVQNCWENPKVARKTVVRCVQVSPASGIFQSCPDKQSRRQLEFLPKFSTQSRGWRAKKSSAFSWTPTRSRQSSSMTRSACLPYPRLSHTDTVRRMLKVADRRSDEEDATIKFKGHSLEQPGGEICKLQGKQRTGSGGSPGSKTDNMGVALRPEECVRSPLRPPVSCAHQGLVTELLPPLQPRGTDEPVVIGEARYPTTATTSKEDEGRPSTLITATSYSLRTTRGYDDLFGNEAYSSNPKRFHSHTPSPTAAAKPAHRRSRNVLSTCTGTAGLHLDHRTFTDFRKS